MLCATSSEAPQLWQLTSSALFSCPQFGQNIVSCICVPQLSQNLEPSFNSFPHFLHIVIAVDFLSITISFGWKPSIRLGFLSNSCLSYNNGSNWLTNASLGFYVRNKDCQPSPYCSVRFEQVEPWSSRHPID